MPTSDGGCGCGCAGVGTSVGTRAGCSVDEDLPGSACASNVGVVDASTGVGSCVSVGVGVSLASAPRVFIAVESAVIEILSRLLDRPDGCADVALVVLTRFEGCENDTADAPLEETTPRVGAR